MYTQKFLATPFPSPLIEKQLLIQGFSGIVELGRRDISAQETV